MLAACSYPIFSLDQIVQRAPVAVIADVLRERPDDAGGISSTLQIRGTLKGRPPGPAVMLSGLGQIDSQCAGGPRLQRGNRYVLFLSRDRETPDAVWSLVDADGGVYQLTSAGVRFPPEHAGGSPQAMSVPPAELVRDIGLLVRGNAARIEDLITTLNLPEQIDEPPSAAKSQSLQARLSSLPRRETGLAIAAAAVLTAGLAYLLWRPAELDRFHRP